MVQTKQINGISAYVQEARDEFLAIREQLDDIEAKVDVILSAMQQLADQGERMQQEGLLGMLKGAGLGG